MIMCPSLGEGRWSVRGPRGPTGSIRTAGLVGTPPVMLRSAATPGADRAPARAACGPKSRRGRRARTAVPARTRAIARGTAAPAALDGDAGRASRRASALDVDEVLEDLVGGGDHARVRLEPALGDDQVGELLGEVDVAHLERAAEDRADAAGARACDLHRPGVGRRARTRVAGLLQARRVGEVRRARPAPAAASGRC